MVSVQFMFQYIYWAKYLGGLVFVIWAENCYIIPILWSKKNSAHDSSNFHLFEQMKF